VKYPLLLEDVSGESSYIIVLLNAIFKFLAGFALDRISTNWYNNSKVGDGHQACPDLVMFGAALEGFSRASAIRQIMVSKVNHLNWPTPKESILKGD